MLLANKENNRKSGLLFCFLFLNWKVLNSRMFTVFFYCQNPHAVEIHGDLECLQRCHIAFNRTTFSFFLSVEQATLNGPVHKGENHVPKSDSDHDPLPDWVCDLNYVCSQALQPPSRSQTGSAHCKVIFCFYCADWPGMASAHISKKCTRMNQVPKELCVHKSSESGFLGESQSKTPFFAFQKPDLKELYVQKG